MLRNALRAQIRPVTCTHRSNFASTVLLTKNWETETINIFRKEAKSRGLSPKGSKAALITRLQEHDQRSFSEPSSSSAHVVLSVPQLVRHASTKTEVIGVPSSSEPRPIPEHFPRNFLDVKLPDLSQPIPERPIHIPFLPDFWDSSRVKAEAAPSATAEESIPKMLAVAGESTHYGGGPSHNLYTESTTEPAKIPEEYPKPVKKSTAVIGEFARDVAEDLGLTTINPPERPTSGGEFENLKKNYARPLKRDERKGVLALFGILAGSWFLSGFILEPSTYAGEVEELIHEAGTVL